MRVNITLDQRRSRGFVTSVIRSNALADFDLSKMSEADRASIQRMHGASRARRMKRLRAAAAAVPIVVILTGGAWAVLFLVLPRIPILLLVLTALPGLALASFVYKKLSPDQ